jgi:hypothetical protein
MKRPFGFWWWCCLISAFGATLDGATESKSDLIIRDGKIVDGSGNPWYYSVETPGYRRLPLRDRRWGKRVSERH